LQAVQILLLPANGLLLVRGLCGKQTSFERSEKILGCLKCDHSNWWPRFGIAKSHTNNINCPFGINGSRNKSGNWTITITHIQHNHKGSGGLKRTLNGTADGSRAASPEHGVSTSYYQEDLDYEGVWNSEGDRAMNKAPNQQATPPFRPPFTPKSLVLTCVVLDHKKI